ncbi:alpha/beta hydrolase [Thorsellia anophelis]|uniref:Pimeloyl-ACP methyl ester carboxylesterase n=1 Tax=Thorsellia anophelis DSM 18579 TaxID=1123402 RepID=A0A1I0BB02_9GAMM|nr:alpha/beta hydrolase [Thorsellia anophelis]SET03926.1 Pimeloyl-ACP methyl ester carboxylesterase [Thorsellia anophelis DSM 18579]
MQSITFDIQDLDEIQFELPIGVEQFTTEIEGLYLSGLRAGQRDKPTLVFIHGQYAGAESWLLQLGCEKLQAHYHLLAWHAPGYGQSEHWSHTNPSALNFVLMLREWLITLVDKPVVLVGHGLGSLIACAYAARFPMQVSGLLLTAPAIGYAKAGVFRKKQGNQDNYMLNTFGLMSYAKERLNDLIVPNSDTISDEDSASFRVMFNLPADAPLEFYLTGEDWQMCVRRILKSLLALNAEAFAGTSWTLMNEDIETYRHYFHGYTEVWAGEFDLISRQHEAYRLAVRYHSNYELFKGVGHLFQIENPTLFNHNLIAYMANKENAERIKREEEDNF